MHAAQDADMMDCRPEGQPAVQLRIGRGHKQPEPGVHRRGGYSRQHSEPVALLFSGEATGCIGAVLSAKEHLPCKREQRRPDGATRAGMLRGDSCYSH